MGFDMATKAGISIGIFDMIIPDEKKDRIISAERKLIKLRTSFGKASLPAGSVTTRSLMFGLQQPMTSLKMYSQPWTKILVKILSIQFIS